MLFPGKCRVGLTSRVNIGMLLDLDPNESGTLKVADEFPAPIKEKGTVSLRCKSENQYNNR